MYSLPLCLRYISATRVGAGPGWVGGWVRRVGGWVCWADERQKERCVCTHAAFILRFPHQSGDSMMMVRGVWEGCFHPFGLDVYCWAQRKCKNVHGLCGWVWSVVSLCSRTRGVCGALFPSTPPPPAQALGPAAATPPTLGLPINPDTGSSTPEPTSAKDRGSTRPWRLAFFFLLLLLGVTFSSTFSLAGTASWMTRKLYEVGGWVGGWMKENVTPLLKSYTHTTHSIYSSSFEPPSLPPPTPPTQPTKPLLTIARSNRLLFPPSIHPSTHPPTVLPAR